MRNTHLYVCILSNNKYMNKSELLKSKFWDTKLYKHMDPLILWEINIQPLSKMFLKIYLKIQTSQRLQLIKICMKRKKREVGNGKGWHELFISACGRTGLNAEPKSAVFMNSLMKCWCFLWSANQIEIKVKESLSSTFCYACTIVVIRKA